MSNTAWQLSGGVADHYEAHLVPVVFAPWAQDLLSRASLQPGDRMLDLACGTGIVARTAAKAGVIATGCDINDAMLTGFQAMLAGDKTAEQQAADMQAAWEEAIAK